jgi:hypothetical protein
MSNILIAKATAALQESVASIIGCDENDATKREALVETFAQFATYMERNGVMAKLLADDEPGDSGAPVSDHHASKVADLLIESGSHPDRSAALSYLLHSPSGQALLSRMHKAAEQTEKETPSMSHSEFVQGVVKQYGIVALAKSMVQEQKSYGLDEHQFTQLATEHAQRLYPNDRPDVAFSKLYQSEESVRRACAVAKAMPFQVSLEPLQVGGEANRGGDVNPNDPAKAIEQLKQLGRDRWPTASAAEQFERALTAPEYHKLARVAVPIPRATTFFPMPR